MEMIISSEDPYLDKEYFLPHSNILYGLFSDKQKRLSLSDNNNYWPTFISNRF